MINRIGFSPSFKSNVIIAGYQNLDYVTKQAMDRNHFKEQLDVLSNNGDDNTVTLVHEKGRPGFMMYITSQEKKRFGETYTKMTSGYVGYVPEEYYHKIKNTILNVKEVKTGYEGYI